jgi:hypothetical protein
MKKAAAQNQKAQQPQASFFHSSKLGVRIMLSAL